MPAQGKAVSEKDQSAVDGNARFPLRVALFGFGTVGSSVARILLESKPEGRGDHACLQPQRRAEEGGLGSPERGLE